MQPMGVAEQQHLHTGQPFGGGILSSRVASLQAYGILPYLGLQSLETYGGDEERNSPSLSLSLSSL